MAWKIEIDIIDGGEETIKVTHIFWGTSLQEAETYKREHTHSCEYFKAALQEGRVIEEIEEIDDDELPELEEVEEDEA
jgi:hypothetical protein